MSELITDLTPQTAGHAFPVHRFFNGRGDRIRPIPEEF
jgi:hypothetical protein